VLTIGKAATNYLLTICRRLLTGYGGPDNASEGTSDIAASVDKLTLQIVVQDKLVIVIQSFDAVYVCEFT
jgi:hypothetical protein